MSNNEYASLIATARSVLPNGLECVSDAGFLLPRYVPALQGSREGGHYDGLFGMEIDPIEAHAKATRNKLLAQLADFHRGKFSQWSSKRPHKRQFETFAEFVAREGKPMFFRGTRNGRGQFFEKQPTLV